jgi:4-hydroxy-tetrahydrodipicolinate synthase
VKLLNEAEGFFMMDEGNVKGIFVPVITPFLINGELDLDSYRSYVARLLEHNIQGVVINGTTGESPTVSWEEVTSLMKVTNEQMREKPVPIVIGTGTNDTLSTVRRTELAGKLGADAALVVVPYYSRPSQEGIIAHFRRAAEVGVPIIVYEIPSRTGVRLSVDTVRTILEINGVIGLKDSSGGIELVSELTRVGSKPVLCGEDAFFHSMLSAGASGGILAAANLETDTFIEVLRLADTGRFKDAKKMFDLLLPFIRLLFEESNPAPLKWVLARQGLITSEAVRLPMSPITHRLQMRLEQMVQTH